MAILAVFAGLLTGCKADATLTVKVRENGSGTVAVGLALDAAAVRAAEVGGSSLDARIRLDDLRTKGWTVAAWQRNADGSAGIEISKSFATAAEANAILADVTGSNGPVRDARLTRDVGALRTSSEFRATSDVPGATAAIAADSELAAVLQQAGLDPAAVDRTLGDRLRADTTLRVVVDQAGERTAWTLPKDRTQQLRASETWFAPASWLLLLVGVGAIAAAVAVLFGGRRTTRRRPTA